MLPLPKKRISDQNNNKIKAAIDNPGTTDRNISVLLLGDNHGNGKPFITSIMPVVIVEDGSKLFDAIAKAVVVPDGTVFRS